MEDIPGSPLGGLKTEFREVSQARKLRSDQGFPHTFVQEMPLAPMESFSRFSQHPNWKTKNARSLHVIRALRMLRMVRKWMK